MAEADFVIAGAGIIGLSVALELERRGAKVVVLERGLALAQASTAAAGMLAVDDPHNPPELHALSRLSMNLYPEFLDRVAELSGVRVPFQTNTTLQAVSADEDALDEPSLVVPQLVAEEHRFHLLAEHSVDPRQLAEAVREAVRVTTIVLLEGTPVERLHATRDGVSVETTHGRLHASAVVDCMGAWTPAPVAPRKGQMLAVEMPPAMGLETVIRTESIYVVPRTEGPNAGRAIIGATVENVGFDVKVHGSDILALNAQATRLLPALAEAEFVQSWAGLRPGTADGLPVLGRTLRQPRYVLANGHFRNGILLAPATAHVVAQVLFEEKPAADLAAFAPDRF